MSGRSEAGFLALYGGLGMKIIIQIDGWKPDDKKQIVNSIRGFVKSLGKRFGFRMKFRETD